MAVIMAVIRLMRGLTHPLMKELSYFTRMAELLDFDVALYGDKLDMWSWPERLPQSTGVMPSSSPA